MIGAFAKRDERLAPERLVFTGGHCGVPILHGLNEAFGIDAHFLRADVKLARADHRTTVVAQRLPGFKRRSIRHRVIVNGLLHISFPGLLVHHEVHDVVFLRERSFGEFAERLVFIHAALAVHIDENGTAANSKSR